MIRNVHASVCVQETWVEFYVLLMNLCCCLCAGTNGNAVYVYDIESKRCLTKLTNHQDDVNAVVRLLVALEFRGLGARVCAEGGGR